MKFFFALRIFPQINKKMSLKLLPNNVEKEEELHRKRGPIVSD